MQTSGRSSSLIQDIAGASRQLSRFSYSAGGIADILGGLLGLISTLAHAFNLLNPPSRVVLFTFPFIWIVGKEYIRRGYYQRYGRINEPIPTLDRAVHIFSTVIVALVCFGIAVITLPHAHTAGQYAYVATAFILPICTWLFFRRPIEFLIGVMLLCQAAVGISGGNYAYLPFFSNPFFPPIVPVCAIIFGILEHRQFLAAARQLHRLNAELAEGAL
jgi:hypothetical protein